MTHIAGLAAYIFTKNLQRSWRVSEVLEYGLVGVNEGLIPTVVSLILHVAMNKQANIWIS